MGARHYSPALSRWLVPDPLGEKYYDISPYAYCAGNPVMFIDPTGLSIDEYYRSLNGKYLGRDAYGGSSRLIDPIIYNALSSGNKDIQSLSTIERDAQRIADLSRQTRVEHQVYIILDQKRSIVTTIDGPQGNNNRSSIEYYPGKVVGASFYDRPGGPIIIGQIHGHPASNTGGETLRTMSPNFDVPTAIRMQIPLYGIDAMYGRSGDSVDVHRVTPSGKVSIRVRRTIGTNSYSNYNNWGAEALRLWGSSLFPTY